jgi:poly-gamma-glutamate synthesis protein (capsule biosynthesis protein)
MSSPFVIAAVGDIIPVHAVAPAMTDARSIKVLDLLRTADVALANFEITVLDSPELASPQAVSGGSWLHAGPEVVVDLRALGFKMVSRANNHVVDFGVGGMRETDCLLDRSGIAHAGTGATLHRARAPTYLMTRAGRTALISATDTAPPFSRAADPRDDIGGRSGVNLIRTQHVRHVDATTFDALAGAIEVGRLQSSLIGKVLQDGRAIQVLDQVIRKGDRTEDVFVFDDVDVENNLNSVREARARADHVIFSLHTHLTKDRRITPTAVRSLARRAIENGADVVMCHGPHCLHGIEIHLGRPIFYSLGNFVFHLLKLGAQPPEFYRMLNSYYATEMNESTAKLGDLFAAAESFVGNIKNISEDWESVIARIVINDNQRTFIELHPIELYPSASGWRQGTPTMARGHVASEVIDRLAELSAAFGTRISKTDGIGIIECSAGKDTIRSAAHA